MKNYEAAHIWFYSYYQIHTASCWLKFSFQHSCLVHKEFPGFYFDTRYLRMAIYINTEEEEEGEEEVDIAAQLLKTSKDESAAPTLCVRPDNTSVSKSYHAFP